MKYKRTIKPKFNGAYSRNNLPKIKDGAYVINIDEFKSIGISSTVFHVNGNNVTYFESFGVENIPKKWNSSQKTKM